MRLVVFLSFPNRSSPLSHRINLMFIIIVPDRTVPNVSHYRSLINQITSIVLWDNFLIIT